MNSHNRFRMLTLPINIPNDRIRSYFVYTTKVVSVTIIVFILSTLFWYDDIRWCLISALLILSPDGKDAIQLAITRIKANIIGAGVALLFLLISPVNLWSLSLALVSSLCVSYLLKLDMGARSALVATIIIMMNEVGTHVWLTAFERVVAVLGGCTLGIIITFIFHFSNQSMGKVNLYNVER